jgi:galactosylceramidase
MSAATTRVRLAFLDIGLAAWCLGGSPYARADQTISVDGSGAGRTYDGIGAVSGGGGTSPLLMDYVEPQRTQILDYLFKPNYGAGLQELYIEIGGDGNSTQGSELSHMHSKTDENYYRGYEWWLMEQARQRNPAVVLDATAWSAPAWVGNGNFWSQDTADYLSKWIMGAKSAHSIDIDYVGCRNEKGDNESWVKLFRTTLNSNGLTNVGIHAFDNWGATSWNWATGMNTDATLKAAVYAIGSHTTSSFGTTKGTAPPANVIAIGKPIWDTEEHVYEHGFQCAIDIVSAFNFNYVNSKITKTIYWYLITAFYSNEPFYDDTMAVASSPWSGNYTINPALWGYAHVGQFTKVGWNYLDAASGKFTGGGNYVTMMAPSGGDYSVIAQTSGAKAAQNITFNVAGGLSTGTVSVWRSNATAQFEKQPDVAPVNGSFTVALDANSIYSISTTTGQQKGEATPPVAADFPKPYYETYDHYADFTSVGYRPYYHNDIAGGFELFKRPDGSGNCLRQVVSQPAQSWAPETNPYTIVGNTAWTDYEVSADVSIETSSGWASVMGRVNSTGTGYGTNPNGYYLTLSPTGAWNFYAAPTAAAVTSGQATLAAGSWHNLKLVFQGTSIKGSIDGTQVFAVTNTKYSKGNVGLGTAAKTTALFDNLLVTDVNPSTKPAPTVFAQDGQSPPDGGTGGNPGTGGTSGAGGATGAGGVTATGGAPIVGGNRGTGGAARTGGNTAAGVTTSAGVTSSAGGIPGPGGTISAGGASRAGGTPSAGGTAGAPETAGAGGAAGTAETMGSAGGGGAGGQVDAGRTEAASSSSGCSYGPGVTKNNDGKAGLLLLFALTGITMLRRRRNYGLLAGPLLAMAVGACSGNDTPAAGRSSDGSASNVGGAGSGGGTSASDTVVTGGSQATGSPGGTVSVGGSVEPIGGSTNAGGTSGAGGDTRSSDSTGTGGSTVAGTSVAAGGTTGASTAAGGSTATGGTAVGGGNVGGSSTARGTAGAGGATASGGATLTGGTKATGGTTSPGDTSTSGVVAATPPMGWNSWNKFGGSITDTLVRGIADAMVSSGMQAAGYQYINIDDMWQASSRDSSGNIAPDSSKFPNGMKALADYVHGKGLKLGLYSDRGTKTCAGRPGSYSYETKDAQTYASWGVDYLKYDNCSPAAGSDITTDYTNMSNALKTSGRPIVFSLCAWWFYTWETSLGQLWRTTTDIKDTWASFTANLDANGGWKPRYGDANYGSPGITQYASPGHWNDPDMLEVGNGGMTDTEYQSHFSLWAIMAAPLIAGNDVRSMTAATKNILTNADVIAVDQDPLGVQGKPISTSTTLEVWSKKLSGTDTYAVVLFNRTAASADITVTWTSLGLTASSATVRDLWSHADLASTPTQYTATVPSHGVVMLKVVGG